MHAFIEQWFGSQLYVQSASVVLKSCWHTWNVAWRKHDKWHQGPNFGLKTETCDKYQNKDNVVTDTDIGQGDLSLLLFSIVVDNVIKTVKQLKRNRLHNLSYKSYIIQYFSGCSDKKWPTVIVIIYISCGHKEYNM